MAKVIIGNRTNFLGEVGYNEVESNLTSNLDGVEVHIVQHNGRDPGVLDIAHIMSESFSMEKQFNLAFVRDNEVVRNIVYIPRRLRSLHMFAAGHVSMYSFLGLFSDKARGIALRRLLRSLVIHELTHVCQLRKGDEMSPEDRDEYVTDLFAGEYRQRKCEIEAFKNGSNYFHKKIIPQGMESVINALTKEVCAQFIEPSRKEWKVLEKKRREELSVKYGNI